MIGFGAGADAFEETETPAAVDATTGVLRASGGARPVRVAERVDRDAYVAWLLDAARREGPPGVG